MQKEPLLPSQLLLVSLEGRSRVLTHEAHLLWVVQGGGRCCIGAAEGLCRNKQIIVRLTPRDRGQAAAAF